MNNEFLIEKIQTVTNIVTSSIENGYMVEVDDVNKHWSISINLSDISLENKKIDAPFCNIYDETGINVERIINTNTRWIPLRRSSDLTKNLYELDNKDDVDFIKNHLFEYLKDRYVYIYDVIEKRGGPYTNYVKNHIDYYVRGYSKPPTINNICK